MATARPNAKYLKKTPTPVHEAFAEYIKKTTGHEISVGDVAVIQWLYPLYLKTPAVVKARESAKAARDAEKATKDEAKRTRQRERLAQIEAQRRKLLEDLGEDPDFEVSGDPESEESPKLAAAKAALHTVPDVDESNWTDPDDGDDAPNGPVVLESTDEFQEPEPEIVSAGEPEPEAGTDDGDGDGWDDTGDEEDW